MDQSKALQKLTETADLVGMIEELVRTSQSDRLSAATVSGMRITLRSIRETILASHDVFAGELVTRTRSRAEAASTSNNQGPDGQNAQQPSAAVNVENGISGSLADPARLGMRRHNLRASLEKLAD